MDRPSEEAPPPDEPNSPPLSEGSASPTPDKAAELPEWEPLTPELVEDEAVRGDFVLRWAVVLLAFLFGCTLVGETRTLVHVRTGEYLAEHGWRPPARDVFSYTAEDRPWINLSWLFDLLLAGVYGLGGAPGLSLLTALVAALTFGLIVHTQRIDTPTWWGSVCAVLALIASAPQLTAQPEIITLLGIAVVLWLLFRWHEAGNALFLWLLVPVVWLWTNLDPRAFLGLGLLVLYGVGDLLGAAIGRSSVSHSGQRRNYWIAVTLCIAVTLLNPFTWQALTAPYRLYAYEYPGFRLSFPRPDAGELYYYPISHPAFWQMLEVSSVAALLLFAITVVVLLLNRSRVEPAHVALLLGFNALAAVTTHELAVASLVNGVLATWNAQAWYRATFRQTYSTEPSELLFSRGGRAGTVLAFLALALLAISGRISPAEGARTGLGFTPSVKSLIDGYQQEQADAFDERPFNFRLMQGDVLIWIGQRPFIDSRMELYHGPGAVDLLAMHDRTRRALRQKRAEVPGSGESSVWKGVFDEYEITHVIPRLSGSDPPPDYTTVSDLLSSTDWQLTQLGAVTATFYRTDLPNPELQQYLTENQVRLVNQAFRTTPELTVLERGWPRPPSFYQKYLLPPASTIPNGVQQARHYLWLQRSGHLPPVPWPHAACLYLAVRKINEGLLQEPNSSLAYQLLGNAYETLGSMETQVAAGGNPMRYLQAVQAYRQSLLIDPNNEMIYLRLLGLYLSHNRQDLALEALTTFQHLTADSRLLDPEDQKSSRRLSDLRQELEDRVRAFQENLHKLTEQQTDRLALASYALHSGYVLEALRILEEDPIYLPSTPAAQSLHATLLLELGRTEQAYQIAGGLATIPGVAEWRSSAAVAHLGHGNYAQAIGLLTHEADQIAEQQLQTLLATLPLSSTPPSLLKRDLGLLAHFGIVRNLLDQFPEETASLLFNAATAALEQGNNQQARELLAEILEQAPDARLRPLVRFYHYLLNDELIDPEPPSDWIPVSRDMFAAEEP